MEVPSMKLPLFTYTLLFFIALAVVSADDSIRYPSMLEISTRPWLYSLSQKYNSNITRLRDIPLKEFEEIRQQGFHIVWLMGVWELGAYGLNYDRTNPDLLNHYKNVLPDYTIDDIIGSPYAPTRYKCNPQLGTDDDIAWLRQTLNKMGLKLMLDFVPNHSAVDAPWTTSNIEYYVRAPKGMAPPYDPNVYLPNGIAYGSSGWGPWKDTAQFNYWNPELVQQRIQELLHVASLADYIRCDMAYLILNDVFEQNWGNQVKSWGFKKPEKEFWEIAINLAKQKYGTKFLAEVYFPWEGILQQWFDFTYDKLLYDRLADGHLDNLRNHITSNTYEYIAKSAHFIENHDEERAAAHFGSNFRANAAALVTMTLPGMRFFNLGQELGYKNRLDVHLRRAYREDVVPWVQDFYNRLFKVLRMPVFQNGTWTYLHVNPGSDQPISNWRLLAWKWTNNNTKVLCVINYSDTPGQGRIILSDAQGQNGNDTQTIIDLLTNNSYERSSQEMRTQGLYVIVDKWFAQIFLYH